MENLDEVWKELYLIWDAGYRKRLELVRRRLYRFDRFVETLSWLIILGLSVFALMVVPAFLFMLLLGVT